MLAYDAARVAPVTARLRTKARRISDESLRQLRLVQNLIAVDVRDRHFRRRDEIQPALVLQLKQIGLELRQLRRAEQRIFVDDKRRQSLFITMLVRMYVNHEIDE